ncbi:hypothetical protein [Acinetobacter pittii]|uniref:Uncharacterized protein n=1 Tax=Acinetobacter pittii TaxID=48296 RepID=A0A6H0G0A6_ACIPI|nr:hypothetical protein [Acinetobacter pittii]QIT20016.1 hypothetical protein G8E09_19595 [Acinetobacter pittii]
MNLIANEKGQLFYTGSLKVVVKETGSVYYISEKNLVVKAYKAKAKKPFLNYRYKSMERIKEVVKNSIDSEVRYYNQKQEYKAQAAAATKKFRDELQVGDILSTSWGYEQTNVEFYQVIEKKGAKCTLREIARRVHHTQWAAGEVSPKPNEFIGEEFTRKIMNNYVKIHSSANATLHGYTVIPETGTRVYNRVHYSAYY